MSRVFIVSDDLKTKQELFLTSYQNNIDFCGGAYSTINISGILSNGKPIDFDINPLEEYNIYDLMAEVGRRIESGKNQEESKTKGST